MSPELGSEVRGRHEETLFWVCYALQIAAAIVWSFIGHARDGLILASVTFWGSHVYFRRNTVDVTVRMVDVHPERN